MPVSGRVGEWEPFDKLRNRGRVGALRQAQEPWEGGSPSTSSGTVGEWEPFDKLRNRGREGERERGRVDF